MATEIYSYSEIPRATRQAVVRDLSQRVVAIVAAYYPEPVLGAEIEAQITESTPVVEVAEGEKVVLNDMALALAREQAVEKHGVEVERRGNQLAYRLSSLNLD